MDHRLREALRQAVRRSPETVVDIGCGRGTLLLAISREQPNAHLIGIELNPVSAAQARGCGISVLEEDLSKGTTLPTDSADMVILGEVIEHVTDPDQCLEELYRILRPGGTLIVTTPNLASWTNRLLLLLGIQPLFTETSTRKKYGRALRLLGNGSTQMQGHIHLYTKGALVEMLSDLGFTCERVLGVRFAGFENNRMARFVDAIFCLRPTLASGLLVVARKVVAR